jgi:hypothetical protein
MKPDRATLIERAGKYFAETRRLEHELAEARAQIAAKDAALAELKGQWERLLEAYSATKARSEQ